MREKNQKSPDVFTFRKPLPAHMMFREDVTANDIQKTLKRAGIRMDVLDWIDRVGKQQKFSKSDVSRTLTLIEMCGNVGDTEYAQKLENFLMEQKNV